MTKAWQVIRLPLLGLVILGAGGVCLWIPLVTYNDMPPWEAIDIARRHALEQGYTVQESGGYGKYITPSDSLGGCEIEVSFVVPPDHKQEVAVRLRRSSALHAWELVDVVQREWRGI